jgi:opacity protein-like surface antigen
MRLPIGFALGLALATPAAVFAQDSGRVGVTMGYPGAIGLVYQVSESVAVRPEFSFSRNSVSATASSGSVGPSESSSWATGVGASALFYFGKHDNVRPYFSPRFAYSRAQNTVTSSLVLAGTPITTTTTGHGDAYSGTGSFGAQYTPGRRFGIFGEVGVGYDRVTGKSGLSKSKTTTKNWATRTAVGAIFYF